MNMTLTISELDALEDEVREFTTGSMSSLEDAIAKPDNNSVMTSALKSIFYIHLEYYMGSVTCLDKNLIPASANLTRSLMECHAELAYMFSGEDDLLKLSNAYGESVEIFDKTIKECIEINFEKLDENRNLKKINPWHEKSINELIAYLGPGAVSAYDFFCYFTHPNPASFLYRNDYIRKFIIISRMSSILYLIEVVQENLVKQTVDLSRLREIQNSITLID